MSGDDTVSAYIRDTQIEIFDLARDDLQLPITKIAEYAGLPVTTVNAWAQGRNLLTLWGVKKLLRVARRQPKFAGLLSKLFEPEEYALVAVMAGIDHDEFAAHCQSYLIAKAASHHPDSEEGREIGPTEDRQLRAKLALVKAA